MMSIAAAGIPDGPHACPKGLRHGFGVQAANRGTALNMVQKWLGHAQLTATAIYANAVGEEEQSIAARIGNAWRRIARRASGDRRAYLPVDGMGRPAFLQWRAQLGVVLVNEDQHAKQRYVEAESRLLAVPEL